jgi:ABC-type spermidine/putrescine transport system permease subunit I
MEGTRVALASKDDIAQVSSILAAAAGALYRRSPWGLLTLPALGFMLVVFLYPLVDMLTVSIFAPQLTLANYAELFQDDTFLKVLLRTLRFATLATLVSLLLAYPLAYVLSRAGGFLATFLLAAIILPLWTSDLIRAYAWTVILGTKGPLNGFLVATGILDRPAKLLYTEFGALLGSVHVVLPFMVLPLLTTMKGIDWRLIQAAASLGANPARTFHEVYLPLSLPGVIAGVVLTFILTTGFYITPAMLGNPGDVMVAMLIETQARRVLNWSLASAMAVVLLAFTACLLVAFDRVFRLERLLNAK